MSSKIIVSIVSIVLTLLFAPGIVNGIMMFEYANQNGHGFFQCCLSFLFGFISWPAFFIF